MISQRNVTKDYVLGQGITIKPVNDVTLEVAKGEFVILIGRSGTGKSTLLNLTAGLIRPTSGRVLIDNVDVSRMADGDISALRSRKIGFVFQFPSLLPSLTILENVMMPSVFASQNGKADVYSRASELLKTMGLAGRMEVYPRQLSAGEQKRAVIARSLINNPTILLADEPTSDLDSQTEREVMEMLREIHVTGVTILMVTHSLQLVPYADRAFEMVEGSLTPVQKDTIVAHHESNG